MIISKLKIILFVVLGLFLASLLFYEGIYFEQSRFLAKCPCDLEIQLPKETIIGGYWLTLKGEITEIGDDYLVLVSENETEKAKIRLISGSEGTTYYQQLNEEEIVNLADNATFKSIELKDIKTNDLVFIKTNLRVDGYIAIQIIKILPS